MPFSDELQKEMFNFVFAVYRVTDLFRADEPLRRNLRENANNLLSRLIARQGSVNGSEKPADYGEVISNLESIRVFAELACRTGLMKAINAEILKRECLALEAYFRQEQNVLYTEKKRNGGIKSQNDMSFINSGANQHVALNIDTKPQYSKDTENKLHGTEIMSGDGINDTTQEASLKTSLKNNKFPDRHLLSDRQKAIVDYLRVKKEAKINDFTVIFENRFSLKTLQRDLAQLISGHRIARQGDKRWAVYRLNEPLIINN